MLAVAKQLRYAAEARAIVTTSRDLRRRDAAQRGLTRALS